MLWLCAVALLVLTGVGCKSREPSTEQAAPVASASDAASQWLSRVKSAHEAVDAAHDPSEREQASLELEDAFEAPRPASLPAEEWARVRQDLAGRLSQLTLQRGDPARAIEWAERGLPLNGEASVFRANLFIARAQAEKVLGRNDAASASLFEALKINRTLLDKELENP